MHTQEAASRTERDRGRGHGIAGGAATCTTSIGSISPGSSVAAVRGLGIDPQIRQVVLFDTSDLMLDGAGVVVRVRRRA